MSSRRARPALSRLQLAVRVSRHFVERVCVLSAARERVVSSARLVAVPGRLVHGEEALAVSAHALNTLVQREVQGLGFEASLRAILY